MTAPRRRVFVSDHAICRYIERAHGWDINKLKQEIADRVSGAANVGACSVIIDGLAFTLAHNPDGSSVVTTVKPQRANDPVKAYARKREGRK